MAKWNGPRRLMGVVCLLSAGCTSLREIPRSQYAARAERRNVRLETREHLLYDFDYIQVAGDSLVGFRRRDSEGPIEDFGRLAIPLDEVAKLSARGVDWYRTGVIGGGVIAVVVAAGLSNSNNGSQGGTSGGGKGGTIP